MSTEKNNPQHSANIHASINGQQEVFSPNQFFGIPSQVRMDTDITTHLTINYGQDLKNGTHTLTHTQFGIEYLDATGSTFTHPVAGTIVVNVVGNNHTGQLIGLKVDGTGSGQGSKLELSGSYLIVVSG